MDLEKFKPISFFSRNFQISKTPTMTVLLIMHEYKLFSYWRSKPILTWIEVTCPNARGARGS